MSGILKKGNILLLLGHNKWTSKCSSSASKEDDGRDAAFWYSDKHFLLSSPNSRPRVICPKTRQFPTMISFLLHRL